MNTEVIFAADDLSGASELGAGIALSLGQNFTPGAVEIRLISEPEMAGEKSSGSILVLDLDSRTASTKSIKRLVNQISKSRKSDNSKVFLKLDSILRGNVRGHLMALEKLGPVVFCPALPALNRFVISGRLIVDGIDLNQSDLWRSEKSKPPSKIEDLFRPGEIRGLARDDYQSSENLSLAISSGGIFIADCSSREDLEQLARSLAGVESAMAAGSGEFGQLLSAELLADHTATPGTNLQVQDQLDSPAVVVGSKSSESESQLGFLRTMGIKVTDLRSFSGGLGDLKELLQEAGPGIECFTISAKSMRSNSGGKSLAKAFAFHLSGRPLVLTGGATARGVLSMLGVTKLFPISALTHGQVIALTNSGTPVAIKPGSFGGVDTLHKLANQLLTPSTTKEKNEN